MITRILEHALGTQVDGNWLTAIEAWAPIVIVGALVLATLIASRARLVAIFNNTLAVRARDVYLRTSGGRDTAGRHRPMRVVPA